MPVTAQLPLTHMAALPPKPASGRRTAWWDPLTLIVLGLAGGALSYDALRQMALAVHIRPHLTYLFPLVIDGFIAYGVRALLVLRNAPWPARAYAWTLFGTATAASLWANALHAVRLNQPGVHTLLLGDHTVAVLSAIAPLALAGATHMHILISRHSNSRTAAAGTTQVIPAAPPMIPAGEPVAIQLAEIIRQTHPDTTQVTRAMARAAIEARGLSAGNERKAEALRALQPGDKARHHPSTG